MIYLSHGEKGGTGKSRLAMLVTDVLLQRGRDVVVVEGDKSGADVGLRYQDFCNVEFINLNRPDAIEEAFEELGAALDKYGSDCDVVINPPGQASETLDKSGEMILALANALDHEIVGMYSLGNLDIHVNNLARSLDSGIMQYIATDKRIISLSGKVGLKESFAWTRSDLRKVVLEEGGKEVFIPVFNPETLETKTRTIAGPFSAMERKDSPLTLSEKILMGRWLKQVMPGLKEVL
ncbi:hypothetical protein HAP94_07980 [Acidithiobacillus ferrivorans]|nr:hypothetical protein [Acidithiobacillus ferrivorans]